MIAACALLPSAVAAQASDLDAPGSVETVPATPTEEPVAADLGAARRYLEDEIRLEDPTRYVRVDPELSRLEGMNELAEGVTWTSMATTAATLGIAIALSMDQQEESAAVVFGLSGGVLIVGLLVQALFRPTRQDVLDVFRVAG